MPREVRRRELRFLEISSGVLDLEYQIFLRLSEEGRAGLDGSWVRVEERIEL